jgi:hypothetical protein
MEIDNTKRIIRVHPTTLFDDGSDIAVVVVVVVVDTILVVANKER